MDFPFTSANSGSSPSAGCQIAHFSRNLKRNQTFHNQKLKRTSMHTELNHKTLVNQSPRMLDDNIFRQNFFSATILHSLSHKHPSAVVSRRRPLALLHHARDSHGVVGRRKTASVDLRKKRKPVAVGWKGKTHQISIKHLKTVRQTPKSELALPFPDAWTGAPKKGGW